LWGIHNDYWKASANAAVVVALILWGIHNGKGHKKLKISFLWPFFVAKKATAAGQSPVGRAFFLSSGSCTDSSDRLALFLCGFKKC
jgi:hypothetical protein